MQTAELGSIQNLLQVNVVYNNFKVLFEYIDGCEQRYALELQQSVMLFVIVLGPRGCCRWSDLAGGF